MKKEIGFLGIFDGRDGIKIGEDYEGVVNSWQKRDTIFWPTKLSCSSVLFQEVYVFSFGATWAPLTIMVWKGSSISQWNEKCENVFAKSKRNSLFANHNSHRQEKLIWWHLNVSAHAGGGTLTKVDAAGRDWEIVNYPALFLAAENHYPANDRELLC